MPTLREWLSEAPFSLCLSSSWLGLYCHAGVLTALVENGLAPSRVSGSSAGALVAVLWAATLDSERMRRIMEAIDSNPMILASLLTRNCLPGIVNVHKSTRMVLKRVLEHEELPRLEDCAIPVFISAFDVKSLSTKAFSEGDATDALAASMAVPLLFKPVWVEGRPYIDGAVGDVGGLEGLEREERVLYHHATYMPLRFTQKIRGFSNLCALKIHGLPYLNPFQLKERGMKAFCEARKATQEVLDQPLPNTCHAQQHSGSGGSGNTCESGLGRNYGGIGNIRSGEGSGNTVDGTGRLPSSPGRTQGMGLVLMEVSVHEGGQQMSPNKSNSYRPTWSKL